MKFAQKIIFFLNFRGELNETSIWTASVGKYRRNRVERGEKTVKVSLMIFGLIFSVL